MASASLLLAAAVGTHAADSADLAERVKNPWFVSLGSFTGNGELGSLLDANPNPYGNCQGLFPYQPNLAVLQAMGMQMSVGLEADSAAVALRVSDRYQTYGLTNNQDLGRPHSVFGVDALFRCERVYFGPGVGIGYASARSGMTFQGAPAQVISAVVGCDVGQTSFAEARLQTASSEAYRVGSLSFGLRF